ncbi:unnamed protein product [Rotaria sordida]|uniref:Uncharacterized protein n=1 Tax=Rotaria sordida TaxID=392033 RepID=A0A813ZWQ7_9BILA|nr:unnamed protein product [Rotaria sordida]
MGAASCRNSRSSEQNQVKEESKKITVGVFGLDNAGKTSAVKAIEGSRTKNVVPTINASTSMVPYPKTTKHDEKSEERIKMIDVSGERKYREQSWSDYYDEIHGLIFVIDASENKRIRENKNTLEDLLGNDKLRNKPILILANKQDLRGALNKEDDIKEKLEIEQLRIRHKIKFCTAIPNKDKGEDSIREGFSWLIQTIEDNYTDLNSRVNNAKNSQRPKPIERKHGKFDESDSDDAIVYPKKRTTSPPLNKFNTDYRSITNSTKLPNIDLNKTKPKISGHDTYSEDENDDYNNNVHSRVRPVVSPVDFDNKYRNHSLNPLNSSTTNTFNKKKKKLIGPPSGNKDTLSKKSNDNEPKSYRASYEPFPEEVPFSSSTKKTIKTDDTMPKPFTRSSISNEPTKRQISPLIHDTKSYHSSSISKGANYSDNDDDDFNQKQKHKSTIPSKTRFEDDDDKKYPSSLSTNKPLSTFKKSTSGIYGADDDDDDDKINNKNNRPKKFQKHGDDDDDENDYLKKTTSKTTKPFDSDDDDDKKYNKTNQSSSDRFNLNNDYRRITSKPPPSPLITTKKTKDDEDDFPSTSLSKPLNRSRFNYDNHLSTLSKTTTRSTTDDDNVRPSSTLKSNIHSKYNDDDDDYDNNFNQKQKHKSTFPSKTRFEDDDDDKKYPSSLSTNKPLSTSKKSTSGIYGADDDDDDDKINNKNNRRPFGTTPTITTAKKFQKHDDDDDENDYLKKTTSKTTKPFDSDDDDDMKNNKTHQSLSDRFNLNNDHRRITSKPPPSPLITTKGTKDDDDFPSSTSKYGIRSKYDNDYPTSSLSKPTTHVKKDDDDDDDDYKSKSKPKVPSKYNDDDDDDLPSSSLKYGTRSKYDTNYSTSPLSKPTTHSKRSDDDRSPSPLKSTSLAKKIDDKVPFPSSKLTGRSKYEDDDDDDRPSYHSKATTRSKYDNDDRSTSPVTSKPRSKFEDDEYPSSSSKVVSHSKYDDDDRPTNSPKLTSRSKGSDDDFSGRGVRSRFGHDDFDSSKGGFNNARAGSASAHRFRPNTNFDT